MCIHHVCNDSCWNALSRPAEKSRPEVGYWITLEDQHRDISNAKDSRDYYNDPNSAFLICFRTDLDQEHSNGGLDQGSSCNVRNLATKPPLDELDPLYALIIWIWVLTIIATEKSFFEIF
jgi:hypothetical protein